jgi:hypothetical protein
MKLLVRLSVALMGVLSLAGCGSDKPTPADIPKQLLNPPTTRPIPSGGNKPPATSLKKVSGPFLARKRCQDPFWPLQSMMSIPDNDGPKRVLTPFSGLTTPRDCRPV